MLTTRYIALLRGINVGGKNIIKMTELRDCLEKAGFSNVSTYIASGNVLFDSNDGLLKVENRLDAALEKTFGYKGPTVVLSAKDFKSIIDEAPKGFGTEPEKYHSDVIFLKLPTKPNEVLKDMLDIKIKEGVDTAAAGSKALYFTRLSALRTKSRLSKVMGLPSYQTMTIRTWNTATKLQALLESES